MTTLYLQRKGDEWEAREDGARRPIAREPEMLDAVRIASATLGVRDPTVVLLNSKGKVIRTEEKVKTVQGKRSPRWAIWQRMTIPCKDGLTYLVRLRILQTPWFGIYLHDIHEDDGDRDPHNHPWSFLSVVLRGYYTERVYSDPLNERQDYALKTHRRLSVHRMGRESAHRIVDAAPGLKTLILTGPRKATWGFFRAGPWGSPVGRFVDWQDYEREIGTL